ncbi:MAG TPA: excinuclease ABC subunit UvrA [Patescibacteria group bacterium]|nr:excinuclease ABC subunit UvrA [Patescibacteria group bacterium]
MKKKIKIKGAREHNLKDINVEFPKNKMSVITGVSGSGKSSLAFNTLFAEGQRRYIESLSSYARQFLDKIDKPDVDEISGLSPAISINQKRSSHNPRSTVATITEIYDYMRVLFARAGTPHCPNCGSKIKSLSNQKIVDKAIDFVKNTKGKTLTIFAPVIRGRKGQYYQLLYDFLNNGFTKARIDGKTYSLKQRIILDQNKKHTIEIIVDELPKKLDFSKKDQRSRLAKAIENGLEKGKDVVTLKIGKEEISFSSKFSCPKCQFSFPEIEPRLFSFNSPYGACEECHGIGTVAYRSKKPCPKCQGNRLRKEALSITIEDKNIIEVTRLSIEKAWEFFTKLSDKESFKSKITIPPLREINNRLSFLMDVGLDYLTLDRTAGTLSGGEAQRIRLATQIGSQLTGTLYVLDEPTIGLHQKDNARLINTLKNLRDLGNTIIVVEHDKQTILTSDYILDLGPGPGKHGGEIVTSGKTKDVLLKKEYENSLTVKYLKGKVKIPLPKRRSTLNTKRLILENIHANNINGATVKIPLQRLNVLTGVSGSGKSTLMQDALYKTLINKLYGVKKYDPGKIKQIKGLDQINRVIDIDQSSIGKTPRSNPATYTKIWEEIRILFAATEEARIRGFTKSRFSFNTKQGRCENCKGLGQISIEMHFLPTVYITCEVCKGKRFDRETLEVKYHNKNIYQILDMTINEAYDFFKDIPKLKDKLETLKQVGLGYLKLGQPSPTLSGGEAQRIKLAKELGRHDNRNTLYLLDEPTTGLHFEDVKKLLSVLQSLVDRGNTVLIIEHNLDVIKSADWVIDLGPGGGDRGGKIVVAGTPELVAKTKRSYTGKYLKKTLNIS